MDRWRASDELMEGGACAPLLSFAEEFCRADAAAAAAARAEALRAELASYRAEAVAKHTRGGRRMTLDVSRLRRGGLLLDSLSRGLTLALRPSGVFRSREEIILNEDGAGAAIRRPTASAVTLAASKSLLAPVGSVAARADDGGGAEKYTCRDFVISSATARAAEGIGGRRRRGRGAAAAESSRSTRVNDLSRRSPERAVVPEPGSRVTTCNTSEFDGAGGRRPRVLQRGASDDINFVECRESLVAFTEMPETAEELMSSHIRAVASLAG